MAPLGTPKPARFGRPRHAIINTRALERYIEGLTISQGRHRGEPFKLLPWQRRFIRGAFSQPGDAALSVARGGGKTTLCAAIGAASIDGPLAEPMAETLIIASSFDQGLNAFRHVREFLRPKLEAAPRRYRIQDSVNRASIVDRETMASLTVKGSDPRRLHGSAPKLLFFDEVAQWPHPADMLAALKTSRGKITDSRALWIGTRPDAPDHPFEKALSGGAGYSQRHAAAKSDPPFQRRTWLKANPGLDHLPDLEAIIRQEAEDAKRDPAALESFKALRLNMGTSATGDSTLLDAGTWERIEAPAPGELAATGGYSLGIDLGQNAAMSAAAAYWPSTGRLSAVACFPELPDLKARGLADGVGNLYSEIARTGDLLIAGRRVADIHALLREVLRRWGKPRLIACDRWREAELRDALEAAQFPMTALEVRGQGFRDGGADVREFRASCLSGKVRPDKSLLLRSAMSEARTVGDSAGNHKLSKRVEGGRRARARDDAAAAAILAVACGHRLVSRPKPAWRYRGVA